MKLWRMAIVGLWRGLAYKKPATYSFPNLYIILTTLDRLRLGSPESELSACAYLILSMHEKVILMLSCRGKLFFSIY